MTCVPLAENKAKSCASESGKGRKHFKAKGNDLKSFPKPKCQKEIHAWGEVHWQHTTTRIISAYVKEEGGCIAPRAEKITSQERKGVVGRNREVGR